MASSKNYGSTYRKARAEWKAGLGPRPVCWLCGDVIDIELHHWSRDSFELDHYYPVSEYPHIANDPMWFRPAHKRCNAARSAHGWSEEEFKQHNTSVLNTESSIPIATTTIDSMQLAIDLMNGKRADSPVPVDSSAVPVVSVDSALPTTKRNRVSTANAKKDNDPEPALVSRDWMHECALSPCDHCREFARVRRMQHKAWLDRHPKDRMH